ncbi:SDR family NAD(P)-dependent oxidoreductase [Chloroflexota bacterium]
MKLTGKVAIVTGAAQGIGEAIAKKFSSEGATIVVSDINIEKANGVVKEINNQGGTAIAVKTDVANRADVENLVKVTLDNFKAVHILVNNAGIGRRAPVHEMSEEYWDEVMNVDLKSVFYGTQAVLGHMKEQRYGKIVNISSIVGMDFFMVGSVNYAAAKAGVIQLTRFTAFEAGRYGINANAIAPGVIRTEIAIIRRTKEEAERWWAEGEERTSLGRIGTAEDVANVALFLVSEDSSYVTGQVIRVDGGHQNRSMDRDLP